MNMLRRVRTGKSRLMDRRYQRLHLTNIDFVTNFNYPETFMTTYSMCHFRHLLMCVDSVDSMETSTEFGIESQLVDHVIALVHSLNRPTSVTFLALEILRKFLMNRLRRAMIKCEPDRIQSNHLHITDAARNYAIALGNVLPISCAAAVILACKSLDHYLVPKQISVLDALRQLGSQKDMNNKEIKSPDGYPSKPQLLAAEIRLLRVLDFRLAYLVPLNTLLDGLWDAVARREPRLWPTESSYELVEPLLLMCYHRERLLHQRFVQGCKEKRCGHSSTTCWRIILIGGVFLCCVVSYGATLADLAVLHLEIVIGTSCEQLKIAAKVVYDSLVAMSSIS